MSERLAVDSLMTADGEVVQLPTLGPLGPVDAEGGRIPLDTVRLFVVEDVRERSLDRPNVMSVTCPSCGMSNSIAWGSLMATPRKEAAAMLADSWNSR